MRVNVEAAITDLNGETVQASVVTPGADGPLTLGRVSVHALLVERPMEKTSGEEKLQRFRIAARVHGGGEVDLTAEEIALIKARIGSVFLPLIVGRAYALLEGEPPQLNPS